MTTISKWLETGAGRTLDGAPEAPRGLHERLKVVADLLRDAGPGASEAARPLLGYRMPDGAARCVPIPARTALSAGRGAENDIAINDPRLSRKHFAVRLQGDDAIVTDLKSRNGVLVNGQRVDATAVLRSGDVIEAGGQAFVFVRGVES